MKQWFNKNIAKITLALASVGAVTGTIGLIMGSVITHNVGGTKSFLNPNGERIYGDSTIWVWLPDQPEFWHLYFSFEKKNNNDIIWNGKYPDGYFNK